MAEIPLALRFSTVKLVSPLMPGTNKIIKNQVFKNFKL